MRRLWVLVAGVVAVAGIVVGPGVAAASPSTSRATSTCSDLVKRYKQVNANTQKIDFSNPKTLSKLFKQAAVTFSSLANTAPSSLRSAFKHLASAYRQLGNVDYSKPNAFSALATLGRKYSKDFQKIGKYFAQKCNFHIPTNTSSPSITVPST